MNPWNLAARGEKGNFHAAIKPHWTIGWGAIFRCLRRLRRNSAY
jgi:hypothetical protein